VNVEAAVGEMGVGVPLRAERRRSLEPGVEVTGADTPRTVLELPADREQVVAVVGAERRAVE